MYIEKLAGFFADLAGPPGIPWSGLIAKGHGIEENGYDPAYMDLMLAESTKFFGVIGSLSQDFKDKYRTIENSEARKAVTQMMALIDQTGTDVWQAVKDGDFSATVNLPASVSSDVFATFAASAANGAYLHFDGVIEAAMRAGKLTPEEVMNHADWVMKSFQTFEYLGANGHLDEFKDSAPTPTSGLGLAPVVLGLLIALGIVVVLGMCYLYYIHSIAEPAQNKIFAWCDQLAAKPGSTDEDLRSCIAAATSMQANGNSSLTNFMGDMLKPLSTIAGIGLAIWLASIVVPPLLARSMTRRATA